MKNLFERMKFLILVIVVCRTQEFQMISYPSNEVIVSIDTTGKCMRLENIISPPSKLIIEVEFNTLSNSGDLKCFICFSTEDHIQSDENDNFTCPGGYLDFEGYQQNSKSQVLVVDYKSISSFSNK